LEETKKSKEISQKSHIRRERVEKGIGGTDPPSPIKTQKKGTENTQRQWGAKKEGGETKKKEGGN